MAPCPDAFLCLFKKCFQRQFTNHTRSQPYYKFTLHFHFENSVINNVFIDLVVNHLFIPPGSKPLDTLSHKPTFREPTVTAPGMFGDARESRKTSQKRLHVNAWQRKICNRFPPYAETLVLKCPACLVSWNMCSAESTRVVA